MLRQAELPQRAASPRVHGRRHLHWGRGPEWNAAALGLLSPWVSQGCGSLVPGPSRWHMLHLPPYHLWSWAKLEIIRLLKDRQL